VCVCVCGIGLNWPLAYNECSDSWAVYILHHISNMFRIVAIIFRKILQNA